jgi:hypothetical protein
VENENLQLQGVFQGETKRSGCVEEFELGGVGWLKTQGDF